MKYLFFFFLTTLNTVVGLELPMLYEKNLDQPRTSYERDLVEHVRLSLEKALRLESKLSRAFLKDGDVKNWHIDIPYYHLLNNVCAWKDACHLHIGLLKGGSFIASLYQNQDLLKSQIGVDWFQEYPEEDFYRNCDRYLDRSKYLIINAECFQVDKSLLPEPVDILLYDADHSLMAHEKAFTVYDDVFADVFVAVIDDWKCPWVRRPTFKAFEKLNYRILFEGVVPGTPEMGHGQYVAVIRKTTAF